MFHNRFWSIKHVPENDKMFLKNGIPVPDFASQRSATLHCRYVLMLQGDPLATGNVFKNIKHDSVIIASSDIHLGVPMLFLCEI